MSEANIFVSEANIFVSEASKLSAGGRFFTLRGGDKHFLLEAVVALMMLMRRLM